MITTDQPMCFPDTVRASVSSRADGTMLDRTNEVPLDEVMMNRRVFCEKAGIGYDCVVYHRVIFSDSMSYTKVAEVDETSVTRTTREIAADALFTKSKGVGLFLPVADCAATVVYDPVCEYLALAHLGRHSSVAGLIGVLMDVFVNEGSSPKDLIVWMSPSAKRESYRMDYFDYADDPSWQGYYDKTPHGYHLDLPGHNTAEFVAHGVDPGNITVSASNTAANRDYYSHYMGDISGRIAVVAYMSAT